ncbi:hypothetical protein QDX92_004638 [Salmonella enterica]|nr:hypothetical protein [Salmonella enterica subsp. enterica serovar Sandiego]ECJ6126296.1 hypothetical protein [Salmonella enterica]EGD1407054.1 hypothetical protein [Salmonella enterica]EHH3361025.1 hypothetical protein [Salmonella enterica subsp. enterica serovar Sandiego]EJE9658125.1 hypothetical protein [Salmonella enterica]
MSCSVRSILLIYGMLMMSGITYAAAGEHSLTAGYASGQVNIDHTRLADGGPGRDEPEISL